MLSSRNNLCITTKKLIRSFVRICYLMFEELKLQNVSLAPMGRIVRADAA